jgi:hypothetical protein
MTLKGKLESRIRGWFPANPALTTSSQKTKLPLPKRSPTIQERLVGGLGASGGGLVLIGIVFYFVPAYPKQTDVAVLVAGMPLLVAAFLVRRTYKH